jgi:DNA-directed RNA polymerase
MQAWGSRTPSPELARLTPFDRSNPLIVREALSIPITRQKLPIGNDAVEMYQNLYACLRVGRMERAAVILSRLSSILETSAPELVDAHNQYFQTLLELNVQDPQPKSMANMVDWYEENMEAVGIQPTPATFVTLLRAAMNFLDGKAQEEAILKYMAMAHEYGEEFVDDINYSPDFTDEEWDILIRAQPNEFEEPPRVEEVQELMVNTPQARRDLLEHGLASDTSRKITIKPVSQKGLGLDSLKRALAIFDDEQNVAYPHDMQGTQEDKDQAYMQARQLRMERDALDAAVSRWKEEDDKLQEMGIFGVMNTKSVQALMYNWQKALVPLFKKHIEECKGVMAAPTPQNSKHPGHIYGPWLESCKPERLAALTVSRAVSTFAIQDRDAHHAFKISSMSTSLGTAIMDMLNAEAKVRNEAFLKKQRKQLRRELAGKLQKTEGKENVSDKASNRARTASTKSEQTRLPVSVRTQLGALCLEYLVQTATITVTAQDPKTGKQLTNSQAAFTHGTNFVQGKRIGFITPNPQVLLKLRNESVSHVTGVTLPMVVEPKPWASFEDGGYFTTPQRVVRQKAGDPGQRAYAESAIENGDMDQVLAGLDVLGKVPWQINGAILEVMSEAWNAGEGIGGLVAEKSDLQRPADPPADAPYSERVKIAQKLQAYNNNISALHSQRCFQNFQLETARAFVGEKKIFFPHSVDFRGRAYPIPPVLNHIGSDVARGLLKFARGKELGTVGLQWMKIHLANLYGFDKASLKEREQFAMDNLDEIKDSATNPLNGRRWWLNAEDPWQCLACCMELNNAFDSPDPTRYVSQLPVHQDGTCNGLQHYAALGGDHAGARQVNLEPSDRPQDIYTGVAELVKGMVAKDAAKGLAVAEFMEGKITRKVVKRTVMTNVYGVTFIGAKMQVEDELKALFPNFLETDKIRSIGNVALYIAFKIFEALGQIFNGAQEIQYWLGECGDRITTSLSAEQVELIGQRSEGKELGYDKQYKKPAKHTKTELTKINKAVESFRTSIIWTTPLRMPVVQPYRKDSTQKVKTKLQEITVIKRSTGDVVDKRKQLQAFPPNFIHSLDATHMTLSALKCHELGLDFAAVHDSFWTHAADIPNLNVILRDAFVRMHSDDIIGRLAEEFKARYAGAMHHAMIITTSTVGRLIRKWRIKHYKSTGRYSSVVIRGTKQAPIEEIALEYKRQKLLKSEDPEEVKQGEAMETPTSIWIANQDPKAITSYRLNLIGETKKEKGKRYDEMRDKVLDHEAKTLAQHKVQSEFPTEVASAIQSETVANVNADAAIQADLEAPAAAAEAETDISHEDELAGGLKGSIPVWIPLSFPPPPKKGSWDVSRLRESKYFFS